MSFSNHENRVQYKSHNGPIMALDNNNTQAELFFSLDTFSFKYFLFLRCCDKAVLMTKLSPYRNKPRLRCSYQNQNQESDLIPFAPCKKIRIPEPGKFLLGESRIWDTVQGIRKPVNDWNPESTFPNDKESVIHIEKSKIPIF